jgi:hypothetical protein
VSSGDAWSVVVVADVDVELVVGRRLRWWWKRLRRTLEVAVAVAAAVVRVVVGFRVAMLLFLVCVHSTTSSHCSLGPVGRGKWAMVAIFVINLPSSVRICISFLLCLGYTCSLNCALPESTPVFPGSLRMATFEIRPLERFAGSSAAIRRPKVYTF